MVSEKGLYKKFMVQRWDGSSLAGGKHEHCDYFVLDWQHDRFTIPVMANYASLCQMKHPQLALDIQKKCLEEYYKKNEEDKGRIWGVSDEMRRLIRMNECGNSMGETAKKYVPATVKEAWKRPIPPKCVECGADVGLVAFDTGDGWSLMWDEWCVVGREEHETKAPQDDPQIQGERSWPFVEEYVRCEDWRALGIVCGFVPCTGCSKSL